jgi:anti-anti-sigma regulatory factor
MTDSGSHSTANAASAAKFRHLKVEETRNVSFIKVLDELIREDFRIRDELLGFVGAGKPTVMLDLGRVQFASAGFLATLVKMHMDLEKQHRKLKVYNLSIQLREVFVNTKLHKYLDIYDNEDAAFQSVQMMHH